MDIANLAYALMGLIVGLALGQFLSITLRRRSK